MRFAAIDMGSNSVRSLVVDAPDGGRHRVIDDERAHTRLGSGVAATGELQPGPMSDTENALVRMLDIARSFGAEHIRVVATAAVRDAENGAEFVRDLESRLGVAIEVITPEAEGRLAFVSAAAHFELPGSVAVFDIGGGSLEVVLADDGDAHTFISEPLGAVRLAEAFVHTDPTAPKDYARLKAHVRERLTAALGPSTRAETVIGSGGTVTALGALTSGGAVRGPGMQGMYIDRQRLDSLTRHLRTSTARERAAMPGMPAHRVDIITTGALVVHELMRVLGAGAVLVNTKGVREGLIIDTIRQLAGEPNRKDRLEHVMELAARYHFDRHHAERVRDTALQLFDQIGAVFGLDPGSRPILESAALLHDVGYFVDYHAHHKHSWHLITHADLPGFSARDLQLMAAVARYHRGALPKRTHEALIPLEASDRGLAVRLGALLRLADGIDRTRSQRVTRVAAVLRDGGVLVTLFGDGDLSGEVYAAREKGDLFTEAFGLPIIVAAAH